ELYYEYESAMSHYAAESALLRHIDSGLEVIYDRMIVPGMIDMKAAAVLPDIFKAARIRLISGTADHLIVRYPGLRTGMRAMLHNGMAYVPVYFKDAEIRFFRSGDTPSDVTGEVAYSFDYVFDRPDIIRRCFELVPEHRMLLLSAAREADRTGIHSEDEKDIVVRALHELDISPDFRAELIGDLCAFGGSLNWLDVLERSDFGSASGRKLFSLLTEAGELKKAYETLNICGSENVGAEAALRFAGETIRQNSIPGKDGKIDPFFTGLCKYLYDNGKADADVLTFLTREYEGNSEEMFRIMRSAAESGAGLNDLPEKIVTVKLFADSTAHIDEAFEAYIENCDYTELILRAYFTVRCTDVFINDDGKDHHILFDALSSYIRAVEDPAALPVIYQLAITKYYSEKEDMDEKELKICQQLTDELIGRGLVFCYTKKLRKKIRVPEEICRRFYVEYHAASDEPPKMLARVVPDEEDYHVADMKRVYRNIYVMSAILFKGDELQYIIYDNSHEKKAAEEGIITVKKFHRQNDDLFEDLNAMTRAIEEKDIDELRERMLSFAEHKELIKELFSLENQHVTEHWS
ncbi:MAG: DUF5717 family protein, partial [Eubacteriales bacterium]|nr:DUF5717 family protein [Eubacteriales bacterium]